MKKILLVISLIVIVSAVGYYFLIGNKDVEVIEDNTTSAPTQFYSMDDVALHGVESDCWFVVEGKVYDVTNYISGNRHPDGGVVADGCGIDATAFFDGTEQSPNSYEDHNHSEKAYGFLGNYYIGDLLIQ